MNGTCVEANAICEQAKSFDGKAGSYSYVVDIGSLGSKVTFTYDAYLVPDRYSVFLPNGVKIFETLAGKVIDDEEAYKKRGYTLGVTLIPWKDGDYCNNGFFGIGGYGCPATADCRSKEVSPNGSVQLSVGDATSLRVVVEGQCASTKWYFKVGCKQK